MLGRLLSIPFDVIVTVAEGVADLGIPVVSDIAEVVEEVADEIGDTIEEVLP